MAVDIILTTLAIWRLASLLVRERGPGDLFGHMRDWLGVQYNEQSQCTGNEVAQAFCCVWCLSLWLALPAAIILAVIHGRSLGFSLILWLTLSAGAILLDTYTQKGHS